MKQSRPPLVRGLPFLGSVFPLLHDPAQFLADSYLRYGPIYRVRAAHRHFTVLAGPEANLFLAAGGAQRLGSTGTYRRMVAEMGSGALITALDGPRHQHLRRLLRTPYSRETADRNLPRLAKALEAIVREQATGQTLPLRRLLQRLITEQLTLMTLGRGTAGVMDDAVACSSILIGATVGPTPVWRLRGKGYRAAKAAMWRLASTILDERRKQDPAAASERVPDLVDIILAARDVDGQPFAEADLLCTVLGPYFAGMDTSASTASFLLYEILTQPGLQERVVAEIDTFFAEGVPTAQGLRRMRVLRGALFETLRLHPVAFGVHRHAVEPFEFHGYRIETGTEILAGLTVSHFLPRFYPEPTRFDIDRFSEPRNEDRQPGAFAPFGVGPHLCLGMGQSEVVIMLSVAMLLHTARVQFDPPSYKMRKRLAPVPAPDEGCRLRFIEQRTAGVRRSDVNVRAQQVNWVLPSLDRRLLAETAAQVEVRVYPAGQTIIREGDVADRFYMILDGEVEVLGRVDGEARVINRLHGGDYFGETGLLTGARRNASVRAASERVSVMELDRAGFTKLIQECDLTSQELARVMRERLVANRLNAALPWLDSRQAMELAPHIEQQMYAAGAEIVRQGDAAESFYVLVRGECDVLCRAPDGGEIPVGHLVAGDFFGETGLLLSQPRNATVRAGDEAEVFRLSRDAFQKLADNGLAHEEIARVMRLRAGSQTSL